MYKDIYVNKSMCAVQIVCVVPAWHPRFSLTIASGRLLPSCLICRFKSSVQIKPKSAGYLQPEAAAVVTVVPVHPGRGTH